MAGSEQELSAMPRRYMRPKLGLALQAPKCQGPTRLPFGGGMGVVFPAWAAPEYSTGTDAPTLSCARN